MAVSIQGRRMYLWLNRMIQAAKPISVRTA